MCVGMYSQIIQGVSFNVQSSHGTAYLANYSPYIGDSLGIEGLYNNGYLLVICQIIQRRLAARLEDAIK